MKSASWIDNQNSRPVIGPIQVPFKRRTTRNSLMGRKYLFCVVNPPLSRSWSKPNTPQCWKYPSPNTPPLTGNTHVKLFPLSPLGSATLFNSSLPAAQIALLGRPDLTWLGSLNHRTPGNIPSADIIGNHIYRKRQNYWWNISEIKWYWKMEGNTVWPKCLTPHLQPMFKPSAWLIVKRRRLMLIMLKMLMIFKEFGCWMKRTLTTTGLEKCGKIGENHSN